MGTYEGTTAAELELAVTQEARAVRACPLCAAWTVTSLCANCVADLTLLAELDGLVLDIPAPDASLEDVHAWLLVHEEAVRACGRRVRR